MAVPGNPLRTGPSALPRLPRLPRRRLVGNAAALFLLASALLFAVAPLPVAEGAPSIAWETLDPQTAYPVEGHTAVVINESLFVFGGMVSNGESSGYMSDTLLTLNATARGYTFGAVNTTGAGGASPPVGMMGHTSVVSGSRMLVWGGFSGSEYSSDLHSWDATSSRWSGKLVQKGAVPSARYHHSAALHAGKMVVFGGTYAGSSIDSMASLDVATTTWTAVVAGGGTWPSARSKHSATVVRLHTQSMDKSCMFVFGGEDAASRAVLSDLWRYCFVGAGAVWEALTGSTQQPGLSSGHAAIVLQSRLVVFGGYSGEFPNDYLDHTREYDAVIDEWFIHASGPASALAPGGGRTLHTLSILQVTTVLFVEWGCEKKGGAVINCVRLLQVEPTFTAVTFMGIIRICLFQSVGSSNGNGGNGAGMPHLKRTALTSKHPPFPFSSSCPPSIHRTH